MTKWYVPWADTEIDWEDKGRFDLSQHLIDRSTRGFSDIDAWSFDTYIAAVLANYMKWNRKFNSGYPGNFDTEEEWHALLKRAEKAFARYAEFKFIDYTDDAQKETEWALKFFRKYFGSFWS